MKFSENRIFSFNTLPRFFPQRLKLLWCLLLVFLLFSFLGISCERDDLAHEKRKPQNKAELEQAKIIFTEEGILQAILDADKMETRGSIIWGWNINVKFYQPKDSVPNGGMLADSGYVGQGVGRRRIVSVFGNVSLEAPDGTKLYSDSLRWNPQKGQVESGSKVKVVRGNEIIVGVGFISDPNFEKIRVKNVSGTISG